MKTQNKTQSNLRNATLAVPLRALRWTGIFVAIVCLLNLCLTQGILAQMPEQSQDMRVLSYTENGDTGSITTNRNYLWSFGYARGTNCTGSYTVTYEDAWKQQYGQAQTIEYTIWLWDTNSNGLLLGTKYTTNIHVDRYVTNMCTGDVTTYPGYTNTSNYFNIGLPGVPSSTYPHGTLSNSVFQPINSPYGFDKMDYTVDLQFYAGYWTNDIPAGLFGFPVSAMDGDTLLPIPDGEITFMEKNPGEDDHTVWKAIDNDACESANADIAVPPGQQKRNYVYSVNGIKYAVEVQPNFGPGQISPRDPMDVAWQGNGIAAGFYDTVVSIAGDQLGSGLTKTGPNNAVLGYYNEAEFTAAVPFKANVAFSWHRDVTKRQYMWNPGQLNSLPMAQFANKTFGDRGPHGNDNSGDPIPDSDHLIYDVDAPNLPVSANNAADSLREQQLNSRAAMRFFAHQWVEADGKQISAILHWYSFVTAVKSSLTASSLVPEDTKFGLTPQNPDGTYQETPSFDVGPDGLPH